MNNWEKVKVISGAFAAVIIPLVTGIIAWRYTTALKEKEINAKLVEVAVNILNTNNDNNQNTKKWAINVINLYSDIKIDTSVAREIITNNLIYTTGSEDYTKLGIQKTYEKDYEGAIDLYDQTLSKDPNNEKVLNYKGYALYKLGKLNEAESNLLSAISQNKKFAWAYYNLGLIYWAKGDKSKAIENAKIFLMLRPDRKSYMLNDTEYKELVQLPELKPLL